MHSRTLLKPSRRKAVAAVEMAFVLALLFAILIGVWELGRIIQVYQIMTTAARDGARLAAQGKIVNTNSTYSFVRFRANSPPPGSAGSETNPPENPPYVLDAVQDSLYGGGITNLSGVNISFEFVEGDLTRTAPFQGLKNERFRIRVTVPYENVRWTNLSVFAPTTLTVESYWQIMVDDPFTVNTTIPGWRP